MNLLDARVDAPGPRPVAAVQRQVWNPAVGRIHDERRPPRADGSGSFVEPEVVIEAGGAILSRVDLVGDLRSFGGTVEEPFVPVDPFLLEIGGFFWSQERLVA